MADWKLTAVLLTPARRGVERGVPCSFRLHPMLSCAISKIWAYVVYVVASGPIPPPRGSPTPDQEGPDQPPCPLRVKKLTFRQRCVASAKCHKQTSAAHRVGFKPGLRATPREPRLVEHRETSSSILRPPRSLQRPPLERRSEACAQRQEPTARRCAEFAREAGPAAWH